MSEAAAKERTRFGRVTASVVAAGIAAYALLYVTQPLLPQLAGEWGLDPGAASWSVSVATGALALGVLPAAMVSEVVGRRPVLVTGVVVAAGVGLLIAVAPSYEVLLVLRAVQGLAIAGIPAVAMAYLAEEVGQRGVGAAIGVLIAGNSVGGLVGRLLSGTASDFFGWRGAVLAVGVLGAVCAGVLLVAMPRGGVRRVERSQLGRGMRAALTDRTLLAQYVTAALLMGGFVAVYNAVGFRLAEPPIGLSPAIASLVFLAYAIGGLSSTTAGRLADRYGRKEVLFGTLAVTIVGVGATVSSNVAIVLAGLAVMTAGFFAAHATASGWVGAQAPATARGQASGLYLTAYYLGSSVLGTTGTAAYGNVGWNGLVALDAAWLGLCAVVILVLTAKR